jgi:hypothetical protein
MRQLPARKNREFRTVSQPEFPTVNPAKTGSNGGFASPPYRFSVIP